MSRVAIVLFNLGGPSSLEEVRPYLFNLFNDPAILQGIPSLLRYFVAWGISLSRAAHSRSIFERIGGSSPLLPNTQRQAAALENVLNGKKYKSDIYKTFLAMRYASPFCSQAIAEMQAWNPEEIVMLPLYPQYSSTTTQSSFNEFDALWIGSVEPKRIESYHLNDGFISASVELVKEACAKHGGKKLKILMSAHGLPQSIVDSGDLYVGQVRETAATIMESFAGYEYVVTFQSRVGPVKWVEPYTDEEIKKCASHCGIVLYPIAFTAEHSETLVELDMEYRDLASVHGVPFYERVPAVSCHPNFIEGLAEEVVLARKKG